MLNTVSLKGVHALSLLHLVSCASAGSVRSTHNAKCAPGSIPSGQYCSRGTTDVSQWVVACFTPELSTIYSGYDQFGDTLPPHTPLQWPQAPDASWLAHLRSELAWSSVYPIRPSDPRPTVDARMQAFGVESYVSRTCPRGYACIQGVRAHTGYVLCRLRPGRFARRGGYGTSTGEWLMPVDGDSTALSLRPGSKDSDAYGAAVGAYYATNVVRLPPGPESNGSDAAVLVHPGIGTDKTVEIRRTVRLPTGTTSISSISIVLYDPDTMQVIHPESIDISLPTAFAPEEGVEPICNSDTDNQSCVIDRTPSPNPLTRPAPPPARGYPDRDQPMTGVSPRASGSFDGVQVGMKIMLYGFITFSSLVIMVVLFADLE